MWAGGGGVRRKVLFRAGWKHIFCVPRFDNVCAGEGSDWVKETHCVKAEWKFIFLWFYDFLFLFIFFYFYFFYFIYLLLLSLFLLFIIFYVLN